MVLDNKKMFSALKKVLRLVRIISNDKIIFKVPPCFILIIDRIWLKECMALSKIA